MDLVYIGTTDVGFAATERGLFRPDWSAHLGWLTELEVGISRVQSV
jgi:hypothetical protein